VDQRIIQFISALRAAGIRVSLAESKDAFQAVEQLGVRNRDIFRISLRTTLVKESQDIAPFEELFPLFFDTANAPPMTNINADISPEEAQAIAEALRNFKFRIGKMLERLMQGDQLTPEELERLSQMTGLDRVTDLRFRNWMVQRMQRALDFPEVREALRDLREMLEKLGMDPQRAQQLRQLLQANQKAMSEQIDEFAGQKIAENMSQLPPDTGNDHLYDRPFDSLSDKELDQLRKEVSRLAASLRTRAALRMKRAHTGQLDAKATIRANLKHGSVPMEIHHRHRTLKPKIVAICDISTSMRPCSELMLSLLYALQDQISKTHAFAFIDHLEYISPDFQSRDARQAVQQVLQRMPSGHYNTDLGYSLDSFCHGFLDTVDSRTTFIIVGDGRNNYNNPRIDLLNQIARRSRRTIWFNPEPLPMWGTGDSDMVQYAPSCDIILKVSNFAELAAAVDQLLTQG
jgi:uncharacterized protein